jgi:hypothetical protein
MWRWGNDLYNTGYHIFTILYSRWLGIDIYLFHYPEGSCIPKHKDPAKYGPHYRFNVELKKAKVGGEFKCANKVFSWWNRVHLFRADANYHRVTKIEKGSRWVFSIGWTNRFKKPKGKR